MFFSFNFKLGFGYELSKRLDAAGANVFAVSLLQEQLDQLNGECPNIKTIAVDLGDWTSTRTVLKKALGNTPIYGLVNNAGITIVKPFARVTEEDYDK